MAYLNQDEEETIGQGLNQTLAPQNQPQQGQPQDSSAQPEQATQQSSAPSTIGGGSTMQSSVPMPQQKQQKAGTGTFTNLRNYLQANQGNRVASAASQRVANVATGAQKGVGQATNVFGQRVEQGSLADMGTARQEAQDIAKVGTQATYKAPEPPTIEGQTQAPPQQYFTEDQTKRFADIINAQYRGPQSLQEAGLYNPAAEKVRTATTAAKQTQSASGRQDLLSDIYGRTRDYSRGQNLLDSLLLNTSEAGVKQLQERGKQAQATQGLLDQAQTGSSAQAQQRRKAIEDIREGAKTDFTSTQAEQNKALNDRITAMTTAIAKDEKGDSIVKRDASGNPMVDANGQPVYLTEWERLPQSLKDSIIDREKTNKATMDRQLNEFNSANQIYANPNFTQNLQAEKNKLEQLGVAKMLADGRQLDGSIDAKKIKTPEQIAELDKQIYLLQNKIMRDEKGYNEYLSNREAITGQNLKNLNLSPEEAAFFGIAPGTGLYNLNADAVGVGVADPTRLISKDELTRLQTLSQLAGLDQGLFGGQRLDTRINQKDAGTYDIEKAGTQSALDAYDRERTLAGLAAQETAFKTQEETLNASTKEPTGFGRQAIARILEQRKQDALDKLKSSSGFSNRAEIADSEESRARASALQQILASRDKTNR